MSDKPFLKRVGNGLDKLREVAERTQFDEIVGAVLAETPLGKAGRVIKNISAIFGKPENEDAIVEAMKEATPEQRVQLAQYMAQERDAQAREREAEEMTRQEHARTEQASIQASIERYRIAMMGDNKFSKYFCPIVGYTIFAFYLVDHIIWRVCTLIEKEAETSETLFELTLYVAGFYFGRRVFQHGLSMFASAKVSNQTNSK